MSQNCIEELKLNKFKRVHLLAGRDLFARVGERKEPVFTSSDEVIPMNMSKLDSMEYLDAYDAHQREIERRRAEYEASQKPKEVVSEPDK